jgi:LysM repeat protein
MRAPVRVATLGLLTLALSGWGDFASSKAHAEGPGGTYVVQPGQTLSAIAHDAIGDPRLWPAIYRANRDQIKDPRILHPGQRLFIPEIDPDPAARERIRREAAGWVRTAPRLEGPDVASAPSGSPPASATE